MDNRIWRRLLIVGLSLCILNLSSASPVESVKALSPPQIQLDGADTFLQWPSDPAYSRYDVYRSTKPYFTPDGSTLLAFNSGSSFRDRCIAGNVTASYTYIYIVRGVRSDGTHDDLPAVGTFSFWLASPWSTPSTLYVDGVSGADTGRCANPAQPCATIGYAFCRAWRGDTVQVAQGIYAETLTINKAVTLRGYEPLGWSRCLGNCTTELRGDGTNPTVSLDITQAERATLDGFKITGGNSGISVGNTQGVCQLGQVGSVGDVGETVGFFLKAKSRPARLTGHIVMAVQDHLGAERWMPADADGDMAPVRVQDVEVVVLDILRLTPDVHNRAAFGLLDIPHRGRGAANQDHKHAREVRIGGQILFFQKGGSKPWLDTAFGHSW